MSSENLVKMANQIAHYFDSEPNRALAVQGVRQHIQNFWTPAMRRQLTQWVTDHGHDGLDAKVVEALG